MVPVPLFAHNHIQCTGQHQMVWLPESLYSCRQEKHLTSLQINLKSLQSRRLQANQNNVTSEDHLASYLRKTLILKYKFVPQTVWNSDENASQLVGCELRLVTMSGVRNAFSCSFVACRTGLRKVSVHHECTSTN